MRGNSYLNTVLRLCQTPWQCWGCSSVWSPVWWYAGGSGFVAQHCRNWVWWHIIVTPVIRRWTQEDQKLEVILHDKVRLKLATSKKPNQITRNVMIVSSSFLLCQLRLIRVAHGWGLGAMTLGHQLPAEKHGETLNSLQEWTPLSWDPGPCKGIFIDNLENFRLWTWTLLRLYKL